MFSEKLKTNFPETTKFLTNALIKGKMANSYIFISKDFNNSFSIAKELSKILNCEIAPLTIPCNQCINCKWLEENKHPHALKTISPDLESKKEQIKIEAIRELLESLNTSSQYFRVIFFQESSLQQLPSECCNLLLKTIEEPPENILFIFSNESKHNILQTIVSRSQIIYLQEKNNSILNKNKDFNTLIEDSIEKILPDSLISSFEKSKKILESLNKNELATNDYLKDLAFRTYHMLKNNKKYIKLYENINLANLKLNSFMQSKIVLEDLFIAFAKEKSH